jgi:hypothetical protein
VKLSSAHEFASPFFFGRRFGNRSRSSEFFSSGHHAAIGGWRTKQPSNRRRWRIFFQRDAARDSKSRAHDRKVTGDDADERAAAAVGKKQSTINVVEGL